MSGHSATLRIIGFLLVAGLLHLSPLHAHAQTGTPPVANTPTILNTSTPSPSKTSTITPTPGANLPITTTATPVSEPGIFENAIGEGLKSLVSTVGTFFGAIIAASTGYGLFKLWVWSRKSNEGSKGRDTPRLTISARTRLGDELVDDLRLFNLITHQLATSRQEIQHALAVLTSQAQLQISDGSLANIVRPLLPPVDAAHLERSGLLSISGPEPSDIKLSLGPLEVPGSVLRQLAMPHRVGFLLLAEQYSGSKAFDGSAGSDIEFTLNQEGSTWLVRTQSEAGSSLRDVIEEIAWAVGQTDPTKVGMLYLGQKAPEVEFSRGLKDIAHFLEEPDTVRPLREAVSHFEYVAQAHVDKNVQITASLLEVAARQLTQGTPKSTLQRVKQLRSSFSQDVPEWTLLSYLVGLLSFYTYKAKGYLQALEAFGQISRPAFKSPEAPTPAEKRALTFYLLSQANMAITKAHQMIGETSAQRKEQIAQEIKQIAESLEQEVQSHRGLLGNAEAEVEWRRLNALIVLELNRRQDVSKGLDLCDLALQKAPYALDVKANAGTLNLLLALEQYQERGDITQTEGFREAVRIFEELHKTEWDPGFVKYRLGMIRRVQGKFGEAQQLLTEASDPEIQDVEETYLQAQLAKANAHDSTLTSADIP